MTALLWLGVAIAATAREVRRSHFACLHDDAADTWMPESGDICDIGKDGDVWQRCRACGRWVLDAAGFDAERPTYVICHGHVNSIDETWIREMAEALPSQANVLAVNWGDGADGLLPHDSAYFIPEVADRAVSSSTRRPGSCRWRGRRPTGIMISS